MPQQRAGQNLQVVKERYHEGRLLMAVALMLVLPLGGSVFVSCSSPESMATSATVLEELPRYLFPIVGDSVPFDGPQGVAVDPAGERLYVADTGNGLIQVFDREGAFLLAFGGGELTYPVYVTTDPSGRVYVSDRGARESILVYSPEGQYLSELTVSAGHRWSPLALTTDEAGNLYVTDTASHSIYVFDRERELSLRFGRHGDGAGQISFANGIAVHRDGNIVVADSNNGRIQFFTPEGAPDGFISGFTLPRGIAIDGHGNTWVADTMAGTVVVIDAGRRDIFSFGEDVFGFPSAVAIDSTGRLYIADRLNNEVLVWDY